MMLMVGLVLIHSKTTAYASSDCDILEGDAYDTCRSLEKKSDTYNDIISLKQRQGAVLADQIKSLEGQVQTIGAQIDTNQEKINELATQIGTLATQITEKDSLIENQKKMLAALMAVYYENISQGVKMPAFMTSASQGLSLFQRDDYTNETSDRVSELLEGIKSLRESLVSDKVTFETKKDETASLHEKLTQQNAALANAKVAKKSLLTQTQTDTQKYQGLLARVEAQKQELFDFSSASNIDALSESVKDYSAPNKKDWASTSWYFSQKDPRWAMYRIGNSKSLMKDYGCAIAAVSMVFRKFGSSIDPGKMTKQKIFSSDFIVWPDSWSPPSIDLVSSTSHGNISWSEIDQQLKKDNPVIVHISKTNGHGGHYVVVTGKDSKDYIVHDPYFGSNLYLGTSRSLVGKIGIDSGTKVDQMIIYND